MNLTQRAWHWKRTGEKRDEKIIAIHSTSPGDVIVVTEKGGGEGRGDKKESGSKRERQTQGDAAKEGNEADGMVQKSRGFEMHSTYFKSTGIKSGCVLTQEAL